MFGSSAAAATARHRRAFKTQIVPRPGRPPQAVAGAPLAVRPDHLRRSASLAISTRHHDAESQQQDEADVGPRRHVDAERLAHRVELQQHGDQRELPDDGDQQPLVRRRLEDAVAQRAEVHRKDQLDDHEHQEHLGARDLDCRMSWKNTHRKIGHSINAPRRISVRTSNENTLSFGSRGGRCMMSLSGGRDAQRQRRQAVARQVDVENRRRQQRQELRPEVHHDAAEHHHLGDVRAQQVGQVLLDVVVDPAAALDRLDDGREVVVRQHDVGRLLGDVGAGDAHGDADVGVLERRRVVDAVAGHRDDVALVLPGAHDLELVHRRDARVDRHLLDDGRERRLVHLGQLLAGQDRVALAEDADLPGDRDRGELVVAGDHHRPDAAPGGRPRTASTASSRGGSIMPT